MRHLLTYLPFGFLGLGVVFLAGFMLAPSHSVSAPLPPLTYSDPIRVLTKAVRAGDPFTTVTTRCNNTGAELAATISVWWQDSQGHLAPFQTVINGVLQGPVFSSPIPTDCVIDNTVTRPFPQGITPGPTSLRGLVCPETLPCTGWRTEEFEVLP